MNIAADNQSEYSFCGGSIYSETVVVTNVQCCFTLERVSNVTIVAGELSQTNSSEFGQRSKVESYLIHPNYTINPETNRTLCNECDICLLFLEDGFDLSGDNVKSIPLATEDPDLNTNCSISGWGNDVGYYLYLLNILRKSC